MPIYDNRPDGSVVVIPDDPHRTGLRTISPREFIDRIPQAKQRAIAAAAQSSADLSLMLTRLAAAQEVNLDNPETVGGLQAMQAAGLLTAAEVAAVLA